MPRKRGASEAASVIHGRGLATIADLAGWTALAATCLAALITASNLGARVTGWGFVIFTVGAIAWTVDGFTSGQPQLLWSSAFLAIVDLFGAWRWLGRRARFSDASREEEVRSEEGAGEKLFSAISLDGMVVKGPDGAVFGHVVDALLSSTAGTITYLIVREGGAAGVGETLRRLPWGDARVGTHVIETPLASDAFCRLASSGME